MFGISKRESILILTLLFAVIGFAIYRFVYVPKTEELKELTAELERSYAERAAAQSKIDQIPGIEEKLAAEQDIARDGAPLFFNSIPQENLIVYLVETAEDIPVSVNNYGFTDISASEITSLGNEAETITFDLLELTNTLTQFYGVGNSLITEAAGKTEEAAEEETGETEDISNQIGKMTVSLSVDSTFEEMMKYLKKLEGYDKEVFVSSLDVTATGTDGKMPVNLTLEFYQIPKLYPHKSDYDFEQWRYNSPKGKTNPFNVRKLFSGSGGNSGNSGVGTAAALAQTISYRNPDFFLSARPAATGLPTTTVGYGPDTEGETYIRSFSEGEEDVTVELSESDGKFYYKLKASSGLAYPESGSEPFIPVNNDIRFIIYSNKRVNDEDVSTVNLSIINSTGRQLNWSVAGEDPDRPRVKIMGK